MPYTRFDNNSKQDSKRINILDNILRVAMREPSNEVLHQLAIMHRCARSLFIDMTDEAIEWLITASPSEHGWFKSASSLRRFLETDTDSISNSRLITGIGGVVTCMAYRAVSLNSAMQPIFPCSTEIKRMSQFLRDHVEPFLVCKINRAYKTRPQDGQAPTLIEAITLEARDDLSDASGVEFDEEKLPRVRLKSSMFNRTVVNTHSDNWVSAAVKSGVNARAHVSGTVPLALAACAGLLSLHDSSESDWFHDNDKLRVFCGSFLIPVYVRGDYHSLSETAAGIEHFIAERTQHSSSVPRQPAELYQIALLLMKESVDNNLKEGESMSLREAVEAVLPEISIKTPLRAKLTPQNHIIETVFDLRASLSYFFRSKKNMVPNNQLGTLTKETKNIIEKWIDSTMSLSPDRILIPSFSYICETVTYNDINDFKESSDSMASSETKHNESINFRASFPLGDTVQKKDDNAGVNFQSSCATVFAAVMRNGLLLQYASEDIQNNFDIVLAAVKQNGWALKYASKELRTNPRIVFEATKYNDWTINYAHPNLQVRGKEFFSAVIKNNPKIVGIPNINMKILSGFMASLGIATMIIVMMTYISDFFKEEKGNLNIGFSFTGAVSVACSMGLFFNSQGYKTNFSGEEEAQSDFNAVGTSSAPTHP